MNYKNSNIEDRVSESPLWKKLSKQNSEVLPFLLERYLLLKNYKETYLEDDEKDDETNYIHRLLGDITSVLLDYQERICYLEKQIAELKN